MEYIYDVHGFDDHKYVICNGCALARSGLTGQSGTLLTLFTKIKELDKADFGFVKFIYNENIDEVNYLMPMSTNHNLLLPNRERALVESIIHIDTCPEYDIVEALRNYENISDGNLNKLYEMANFYNLDKDTLDYWLSESREDIEG